MYGLPKNVRIVSVIPGGILSVPSIGYVFVCRRLSPHLRVSELDHRCLLSLCCFLCDFT